LSSRIYGLAALVGLGVLVLAGLLLTASERTRAGFLWVEHTEEVLRTAEGMQSSIREAESDQRSFLLTRSPVYLPDFDAKLAGARDLAAALTRLTPDNPAQQARAKRIETLAAARSEALKTTLVLAQSGRFDSAIAIVSTGKGRALMEALSRVTDDLMAAERGLLKIRVEAAERHSASNRLLLLAGVPVLALLFASLAFLLVRSVRRPLADMLEAMSSFGGGDLTSRASIDTGTTEFDGLAGSYNAMADRLSEANDRQRASDEELVKVNAALLDRGEALAARSRSTELLASMAHRMQACRTDAELTAVLRSFLPRVLPDTAGALYAHNNSRNMLVKQVDWGDPAAAVENFSPGECWGLRRGQAHVVAAPGSDITCAHLGNDQQVYRCEPILAGGEVVGLLYLEGIVGTEEHFRLTILVENIALSLVNHRLQRTLREQSIRDPLTNLFNRRYMEEALATEVARSARSGLNLGIVMCDVDHFKSFNDRFGHEAGDVLLQAVGGLIRSHFRDGDVACRYGGEEFAIIAPGADVSHLRARAERLRRAVAALSMQHQGRALGDITMSFGIASWPVGADGDAGEIVRAADAALYEAKGAGRNRVVAATPPLKLEAAE
jgi:diguanylate cyclase (GGDEF)-like protein